MKQVYISGYSAPGRQSYRNALLALVAFFIFSFNAHSQSWNAIDLINFNSLTYESDYTTNGTAYYENSLSPTAGPKNGLINGSWEVSNTNLGATQSPSNASGGRFLMYWTDNQYSTTAPAGTVFSKTYSGLTIGRTYRYSFKYGFLLQNGSTAQNLPALSVRRDGTTALNLPALSTSWATASITFIASSTTHTLSIYNTTTATSGNDFGLDDIQLEVQQQALPVSLVNFTVKEQQNEINLNWETLSEQQNKGFVIERSADATNWISLGFVPAQSAEGNSNQHLYYAFTDPKPNAGIAYYRLKQTDLNGAYTYSPVQKLNRQASATISIYPNPATDHIAIGGISGGAQFDIRDVSGNLVLHSSTEDRHVIPIHNLVAGYYFIAIRQTDGTIKQLSFLKH